MPKSSWRPRRGQQSEKSWKRRRGLRRTPPRGRKKKDATEATSGISLTQRLQQERRRHPDPLRHCPPVYRLRRSKRKPAPRKRLRKLNRRKPLLKEASEASRERRIIGERKTGCLRKEEGVCEEEEEIEERMLGEDEVEEGKGEEKEAEVVTFRPFRPMKKKVVLKTAKKTEVTVPKPIKRIIRIAEVIAVGDLAKRMGVKGGELIKKLMEMGVLVNINQPIDADVASLVAERIWLRSGEESPWSDRSCWKEEKTFPNS